jgi:hypothetical protein
MAGLPLCNGENMPGNIFEVIHSISAHKTFPPSQNLAQIAKIAKAPRWLKITFSRTAKAQPIALNASKRRGECLGKSLRVRQLQIDCGPIIRPSVKACKRCASAFRQTSCEVPCSTGNSGPSRTENPSQAYVEAVESAEFCHTSPPRTRVDG